MTPKLLSILICIVTAIAMAIVFQYSMGITAAIAVPESFFNWFKEHDILIAGIVLWDIFVILIPGAGIGIALVTYLVIKHSSLTWKQAGTLIILSNLFYIFIASPIIDGTEFYFFKLAYWQHSYELVLVSSVFMSGYVASRLNKSVK